MEMIIACQLVTRFREMLMLDVDDEAYDSVLRVAELADMGHVVDVLAPRQEGEAGLSVHSLSGNKESECRAAKPQLCAFSRNRDATS
ncbi:hypothetical protein V2J09_014383 [Rumex salicifolius]